MLPKCTMNLFGFGQPIVSDIPIAGALRGVDGGDETPPVEIRQVGPKASTAELVYRLEGETLIFAPPDVAEYHCSPTAITIVPEPGASAEEIEALLIATALPATQWMQGHFMLHASTVILPGHKGAIAIAGPSGSGKSTIAAELLDGDAHLVGDDSIRIVFEDGQWTAAGLASGLFVADPETTTRNFMPIGPERAVMKAPLEAIFILGERGKAASMRELGANMAVRQLLAMQHRPRIPAILKKQQHMLAIAAGIAKALPIYDWQRRSGSVALEQFEWAGLMRVGNGE